MVNVGSWRCVSLLDVQHVLVGKAHEVQKTVQFRYSGCFSAVTYQNVFLPSFGFLQRFICSAHFTDFAPGSWQEESLQFNVTVELIWSFEFTHTHSSGWASVLYSSCPASVWVANICSDCLPLTEQSRWKGESCASHRLCWRLSSMGRGEGLSNKLIEARSVALLSTERARASRGCLHQFIWKEKWPMGRLGWLTPVLTHSLMNIWDHSLIEVSQVLLVVFTICPQIWAFIFWGPCISIWALQIITKLRRIFWIPGIQRILLKPVYLHNPHLNQDNSKGGIRSISDNANSLIPCLQQIHNTVLFWITVADWCAYKHIDWSVYTIPCLFAHTRSYQPF